MWNIPAHPIFHRTTNRKVAMKNISPTEITPKPVYLKRREFMKLAGTLSAGALLAACGVKPTTSTGVEADAPTAPPSASTDEFGDKPTAYKNITTFNNFYEFSTDKEQVAELSRDFKTQPWTVSIGGLVKNPQTSESSELIEQFGQEERVYRLRCVEGWSMVIPWMGFPLQKLLAAAEPTAEAQFVRFESVYDPKNLPGQNDRWYDWPYAEGLRLDEAMHDLTLMATGLYGEPLPAQNGAPLRLVVPWKYGFKSIKSIVKIELVDTQPLSLWMRANPREYGFYSNVNPEVAHPRWSQSSERRIGELGRRDTLPFNGYADEVAHLYAGMDLNTPNDAPYHPLAG